MSEVDLVKEVQEQHYPYAHTGDPCLKCNEDYPCEKTRLADEVEQMQEALKAQKEYIEFLEEACARAGQFLTVHGMTVSAEDFEKGEHLREKIARTALGEINERPNL